MARVLLARIRASSSTSIDSRHLGSQSSFFTLGALQAMSMFRLDSCYLWARFVILACVLPILDPSGIKLGIACMVDDRLNDVSNKIILLSIRRLVATVNDYFCWTLEFEIIRFLITRSQSQRDCLSVEVGQLEIQEPTTIAIHVVHFYGSNDAVAISVK